MGRYSKLIAVPVGSAITAVVTPIIMSLLTKWLPDVAADPNFVESLKYLIFIVITGGTVWAAPANKAAAGAAVLLLCLLLPSPALAQEVPAPETRAGITIDVPDLPGVTVDSIVQQAMKLAQECAQDEACIRAGAKPNPIITTFDRTCRAATDYAQLADTATTMFAMGWQASKDHYGIDDGEAVIEANPALASIIGNSLLFAGAKWLTMQGIKRAADALRNSDHRAEANLAECGSAAALSYVAFQNHQILAGLGH